MSNSNDKLSTKKDLIELKKELTDKLATKGELKKLAAKEELKKLATREELQKVENKLIGEIVKIRAGIAEIETKADAEKRCNLIIQATDNLAAKIDSYKADNSSVSQSLPPG